MVFPVAAAILGGGSLLSGIMGKSAAKDAAASEAAAAQAGIDEQRRQFDITQGNLNPFVNAGQGAISGVQNTANIGTGALNSMQRSGTLGGLDSMLAQIFGQVPMGGGGQPAGQPQYSYVPGSQEALATAQAAYDNYQPAQSGYSGLTMGGMNPTQLAAFQQLKRSEGGPRASVDLMRNYIGKNMPEVLALYDNPDAARRSAGQDGQQAELLAALEAAKARAQPMAMVNGGYGEPGSGGGSGFFDALKNERMRAVQSQLGAGGLTRSGTALQEIADVPTDLGMQIEQMLYGRQGNLAQIGQGAEQSLYSGGINAASGLGQLGAQTAGNIQQGYANMGQAQGAGALTGAQSMAAGINGVGRALTMPIPGYGSVEGGSSILGELSFGI